jgi:two-component system, OmpR family, sensor histidine kinase BaeS
VNVLGRLSLRVQLALAMVAVALLGIGIATLFSNFGLPGLVNQAAHSRLQRQAGHLSSVAAAFHAQEGRWTLAAGSAVVHEGKIAGIEAELLDVQGKRIAGRAGLERSAKAGSGRVRVPILVKGRRVGVLVAAPLGNQILTPEEQHLRHSLDRLHLVSAGVSALAALLVALLLAETLARPLRRIRLAAERMEEGELEARVDISGSNELASVGHALNRLAATLEHEEEVRRESVADLAHELRTPMSGLLSRIEAAQDGVLEDMQANLEAMHAEVLRLSVLLDDLTRLAEAQRPGMLIEKQPLDLAKVGEEQALVFAPRFAEKGIDFETALAPTVVLGDAGRLSQIVSNLLENALRYTPSSEGVVLRVRAEAESAVLEVTDKGIGIAPEDLRHIFTRFWRGEKSRSRETGGAGIGLAIVAELVHAHDGRIDVESKLDEGSTFRVSLPRAGAG